jgi:hypothetical protein
VKESGPNRRATAVDGGKDVVVVKMSGELLAIEKLVGFYQLITN